METRNIFEQIRKQFHYVDVNHPGFLWYFTFILRLQWKTAIVSVLASLSAFLSYKYNILVNLRGNNIIGM